MSSGGSFVIALEAILRGRGHLGVQVRIFRQFAERLKVTGRLIRVAVLSLVYSIGPVLIFPSLQFHYSVSNDKRPAVADRVYTGGDRYREGTP